MIEHGVLMKTLPDGTKVPAGMGMMNKELLRIAIVEADENGNIPDGFVTEELQEYYMGRGKEELIDYFSRFTIPMEGIITKALSRWTNAEIEFVDYTDEPDVSIFPYTPRNPFDTSAGVATVPVNDDDMSGTRNAVIAINTERYSKAELVAIFEAVTGEELSNSDKNKIPETKPYEMLLLETLEHEIGHAVFGILHPHSSNGSGAIDRVIYEAENPCNAEEVAELAGSQNPDIMSYGGEHQETWYTKGARRFLQTGENTLKP